MPRKPKTTKTTKKSRKSKKTVNTPEQADVAEMLESVQETQSQENTSVKENTAVKKNTSVKKNTAVKKKTKRVTTNMQDNRPFVSIVTPTKNRASFMKLLKNFFLKQTYPQEKMEWLIYDDSDTKIEPIIKDLSNVRYFHSHIPMTVGYKREFLNKQARGKYIVCMDDDDYYPPERVEHAVEVMTKSGCELAGSSLLYVFFLLRGILYKRGPYKENHSTNQSMAYSKNYANTHHYNLRRRSGEEWEFTKGFTERMVQLDPKKTVVCIAHPHNTIKKRPGEPAGFNFYNYVNNKNISNYYLRMAQVIQPIPLWKKKRIKKRRFIPNNSSRNELTL